MTEQANVGLRSLGGVAPPASFANDLRRLLDLAPAARAELWELLEPNLGPRVAADAAERATRFCAAHGLRRDDAVPLVRACRFLFRQAASVDASAELVRSDVAAAIGDEGGARELAELYRRALPAIRGIEVLETLEQFGPVLHRSALRVDRVTVSRHAAQVAVPVALLTLEYSDGGAKERLTLQLSPRALAELREVLART